VGQPGRNGTAYRAVGQGADLMYGKEFLRDKIIKRFGIAALQISAVLDEPLMRHLLEQVGPIRCAIETGTHCGFSALILSDYADEVHTIDVADIPPRQDVFEWSAAGDLGITFHHVRNDEHKRQVIADLGAKPDFAFIDGMHKSPGIESDFEMLRHTGRLLFHDYCPGHGPDNERTHVLRFVASLHPSAAIAIPPFAYWVAE
jgi:hypothetical protein